MPGGDRTGPRGDGLMTGRATGFCGGCDVPGYMNPGAGYGGGGFRAGRGRGGFGRGYSHMYYAAGLPRWMRGGRGGRPVHPRYYSEYPADAGYAAVDVEGLKEKADFLEKRLKSISDRIRAMEADSGKENG